MSWTDRVGRRLTPRDLDIFLAVVETGSMARAAEKLAISRPVVSRSISDLEALLNVSLLDRTPTGVVPTIHGQALLDGGRAVFDELRQTVQSVMSLSNPEAGKLRIAATELHCGGLVAAAIESLYQRYPGMQFEVLTGASRTRMDLLRQRQCDIAVARLSSMEPDADIDAMPLFHEQPRLVCGPGSQLASRNASSLAELIDQPWILSPQEIMPGGPFREAFRNAGLPMPTEIVISDSLNFRYALLKSGPWITAIVSQIIDLGKAPDWITPLRPDLPRWALPTVIATLRGRSPIPAATLFIEEMKRLTMNPVKNQIPDQA